MSSLWLLISQYGGRRREELQEEMGVGRGGKGGQKSTEIQPLFLDGIKLLLPSKTLHHRNYQYSKSLKRSYIDYFKYTNVHNYQIMVYILGLKS